MTWLQWAAAVLLGMTLGLGMSMVIGAVRFERTRTYVRLGIGRFMFHCSLYPKATDE